MRRDNIVLEVLNFHQNHSRVYPYFWKIKQEL